MRGNGKIIQELESEFRGSGWNVIKLIWGSYWDPLLARDKDGILRKVMMDTVDGDYQAMKANDGAFVRKHFFGQDKRLLDTVAKMSDEDIWRLNRGGHDPQKVYAAFHRAAHHQGQPTVLLVKTVKGFGMGKSGEGRNTAHQTKKMVDEDVKTFRDRFNIPIPDDQLADIPFYKPADDTPEMKYLHERREALGGYLPQRRVRARRAARRAAARDLQGGTRAYCRRSRDLDHAGLRALPVAIAARQGDRAARRAHSGRRGTHLRHGGPVQADRPSTTRKARSTRRSTATRSCTTARTRAAKCCRRGINEPGGMSSWIRRGHVVLDEQPHHDSVLCLLLDVRLPARRRTWPGRPATCGRAAFCSVAPRGAPP